MVIDYYSKYIEALQLKGKASQDVFQGVNEIFSRHEYPETLVADNMPYNSREIRSYVQRYVNRSFIRYLSFRYTDQILNMVKNQRTWHKIPLKGKPLILK